jgi:outer membrane protein
VDGIRLVQDAEGDSQRRPPQEAHLLIRQGDGPADRLQVVGAYQSVLYAQREIDVAQHEQETAAALLASVEDHVKAGLAVESDRMAAQVNVAARKEELIAAQGDLELAWAQLREAMGTPDLKASELKPIEPHTFPQLRAGRGAGHGRKGAARSDRAGAGAIGAGVALGAAKSDFGPRVSAYGNWEEDRTSFAGSGGNNWVAGVQISVDILPLGKRAQLAQESAAKQKIDAQLSCFAAARAP